MNTNTSDASIDKGNKLLQSLDVKDIFKVEFDFN